MSDAVGPGRPLCARVAQSQRDGRVEGYPAASTRRRDNQTTRVAH